MSLPLLESELVQLMPIEVGRGLMPSRAPEPGEQYRFHFDMSKCIGCKCCEVACNEQNGNPAEIQWRRVGEIEAGEFPFTQRLHLSMGCNHCVDAACLTGCPVDAYTKDGATGLVLHSADACIGCQYCTWNCPYGVPQFNEERGVVGKCDMCHGRLEQGREPACANACPQGAIAVEIVDIADWKQRLSVEANAPGMPPAEATISTTRITKPKNSHGAFRKGDYDRVRPEAAHWPLVVFLTLTQVAWGVLTLGATHWLGLGLLALGMMASVLHLGRPIHAMRAMKMWRRSWLSREVVLFTAYAGLALVDVGVAAWVGVAAIYSSARIYMVPARPAWRSWRTVVEFGLTAAIAGAVAAGRVELAVGLAVAQGVFQIEKWIWLRGSDEFELRQSGRLLAVDLRWVFVARLAMLLGVLLPFELAIGSVVLAEGLGRYLFFVTVVPRNMAATFSGHGRAA